MRRRLAAIVATLLPLPVPAAAAQRAAVAPFGPSAAIGQSQTGPSDVEPDTGQPAPPPPPAWIRRRQAEIEVLDKIDALSRVVVVPVGQSARYNSLSIAVQACGIRPPGQVPDAAAYLVITDNHAEQPGFRGWMLKQEPWVAMLQSPVYDVRLLGCRP